MLEILKYIFSSFWIFIGTCILLDFILINIFRMINNYFKYRCIAKLSKDGKTAEEIDVLFTSKKEDKEKEDK
jgi:hypothetical protein